MVLRVRYIGDSVDRHLASRTSIRRILYSGTDFFT